MDEIQDLQNAISEQAVRHPLPKQFIHIDHPKGNCIYIINTDNNKLILVPLYAYGEVREALHALL